MQKLTTNSKGFGLLGVLIVIVVLALATGGGVYAYHKDHKTKVATVSTQKNTMKSKSTSSTSTTSDPYAGWKTGTLKYEMATFRYPSPWKVNSTSTPNGTAGTVLPGSDQVILTSPTGLTVSIKTGVTGIGDGFGTILSTKPILTLGGSYYLNFYTNDTTNLNEAQAACIGTLATNDANYPYSKNIKSANSADDEPFDVICLDYPSDQNGDVVSKPVSSFENDSSFTDAQLIIESLAY
jgi:hypothetical protein